MADQLTPAIPARVQELIKTFEASCDAMLAVLERMATIDGEIDAVIDHIPAQFRVRVREGAGPENLLASLSVSVGGTVRQLTRCENALAALTKRFAWDFPKEPAIQAALELIKCPDCQAAAAHSYSDATTPGFFYDRCKRHRDAL